MPSKKLDAWRNKHDSKNIYSASIYLERAIGTIYTNRLAKSVNVFYGTYFS